MNWQLISFFGDSTVLLPSAAALFIVLMLRKTSRLLAWQWSLLFGITGAIVCASKLAFMGWGLGIRELDYTGFSGHSALSAAFWPIFLWLLSAPAATSVPITRLNSSDSDRISTVIGKAFRILGIYPGTCDKWYVFSICFPPWDSW